MLDRNDNAANQGFANYPLSDTAPLAIDLYCGLGGWAEGFLSEGYRVIGFDIEAHDYGTGGYPGELVIQDVRTLHGSQFKDATVIVASPPCQAYSYRAMPWKRAKALPPPDNTLFEQPFRIQREACEASSRYIPLIVENVRGAQKWVGRSQWNFGSYHLWGDIPALMPIQSNRRLKFPCPAGPRMWKDREIPRLNDGMSETEGRKDRGSWFGDYQAQKEAQNEVGLKQGGDWFGKAEHCSMSRRYSSRSKARKAASAQIAKIPFPLAQHIARVFKPVAASLLFLLAFSSPRKVAMADDACTSRQLSLNFNITKEHVPTAELYKFATPVSDLSAQPDPEVTSISTLEPGALPPALDELAKKYRPLIDRVLARLSEAERKEVNTHLQQDIRQAWITVSYAQRMSDAFVQASYAIYGRHPDQIWPSIVADRKARLGAEYHDWYDSNDMLRPDIPKIPPTSSAAFQGGKAAAGAGSLPIAHRPAPDPHKEKIV